MKNRLPYWFKQEIPGKETFEIGELFRKFNVHSVCQEAKCPNISHCFKKGQATFLILGDKCTRNCKFCNIKKTEEHLKPKQGRARRASDNEPDRVRQLVERLGLKFVVITSVTRDDLPDGGAGIFAKSIRLIKELKDGIIVEALIPDFKGKESSLECLITAKPDIVAHNIETVNRLYKKLRPMADYSLSLGVLEKIKELKPELITKSSLILGLGETEEEVTASMRDLRKAKCDLLTLGQYLSPSPEHYPVKKFIDIGQFEKYRETAESLGFKYVLSGPKVRSSFNAQEAYNEFIYS